MESTSEESKKEGLDNAQAETNSTESTTKAPTEPPKKSKRESNKKEDEYVKQFMKAVNAASTVEEKVQIACQKYAHMVDDNKKMQFYIKQSEKRHALLMKEKEQLQLEFNKTVLVKSKLENLCRELQKQNKAIKEESLHKIREEEERRKETQAKFQTTLAEITTMLHQNNEKNTKLRDDNISMTEQFKSVLNQYQLREQQVEKMSKQMSLAQQLSDAKFLKASLEHQAEKERMLAEMEGLKVTVAQYRAKAMEMQATENGLRTQLAVYTDKYDEFQNALVKSNQVFGGFKEEMEKMSKKIKKLEKESLSWKNRWETSQAALIEMCTERQASEQRAAAAARRTNNLQGLCRTMQAERTALLNTLKEHNIERPPLPPPPAPAPPTPPNDDKVDAMAANCAQLRQSLAHLQSQLNVLTNNKQQQPIEETPKTETKTKKSKSKKSKKVEKVKESESDSNAKESATENESAAEEKVKIDKNVEVKTENNEKTSETTKLEDKGNETSEQTITKIDDDKENDVTGEKVDDKTLESLIQAINNANINLCDLEVVGDDSIDIDDVLETDLLPKDDVTKNLDLETTKNDISNEVTKNTPKIIELPDDVHIGAKIVEIKDIEDKMVTKKDIVGNEATSPPKIVEITEVEATNGPKIVEIVEKNSAKVVEITNENEKLPESNIAKDTKTETQGNVASKTDSQNVV